MKQPRLSQDKRILATGIQVNNVEHSSQVVSQNEMKQESSLERQQNRKSASILLNRKEERERKIFSLYMKSPYRLMDINEQRRKERRQDLDTEFLKGITSRQTLQDI
jgi:hypothetical protein